MARRLFVVVPPCLAILIVMSQTDRTRPLYVLFFLAVAALWLGMNNSVREIVRERRLTERDFASGLTPSQYLLGKIAFCASSAAIQVAMLLATAWILSRTGAIHVQEMALIDLKSLGAMGAVGVSLAAFMAALCGALLALTVSTVAKTETVAVGFMPLLVLPQILLSRIAYGGRELWSDPSPFGPVAITGLLKEGTWTDRLIWLLSLPIATRPAAAVMDFSMLGTQAGVTPGVIVAEWLYMFILMICYAFMLLAVFRFYAEKCRLSCGW